MAVENGKIDILEMSDAKLKTYISARIDTMLAGDDNKTARDMLAQNSDIKEGIVDHFVIARNDLKDESLETLSNNPNAADDVATSIALKFRQNMASDKALSPLLQKVIDGKLKPDLLDTDEIKSIDSIGSARDAAVNFFDRGAKRLTTTIADNKSDIEIKNNLSPTNVLDLIAGTKINGGNPDNIWVKAEAISNKPNSLALKQMSLDGKIYNKKGESGVIIARVMNVKPTITILNTLNAELQQDMLDIKSSHNKYAQTDKTIIDDNPPILVASNSKTPIENNATKKQTTIKSPPNTTNAAQTTNPKSAAILSALTQTMPEAGVIVKKQTQDLKTIKSNDVENISNEDEEFGEEVKIEEDITMTPSVMFKLLGTSIVDISPILKKISKAESNTEILKMELYDGTNLESSTAALATQIKSAYDNVPIAGKLPQSNADYAAKLVTDHTSAWLYKWTHGEDVDAPAYVEDKQYTSTEIEQISTSLARGLKTEFKKPKHKEHLGNLADDSMIGKIGGMFGSKPSSIIAGIDDSGKHQDKYGPNVHGFAAAMLTSAVGDTAAKEQFTKESAERDAIAAKEAESSLTDKMKNWLPIAGLLAVGGLIKEAFGWLGLLAVIVVGFIADNMTGGKISGFIGGLFTDKEKTTPTPAVETPDVEQTKVNTDELENTQNQQNVENAQKQIKDIGLIDKTVISLTGSNKYDGLPMSGNPAPHITGDEPQQSKVF